MALLLFLTCADVHGVKEKVRGMPGLRKERTAAGQALAISIPRIEAGADHLQSEILAKSAAR